MLEEESFSLLTFLGIIFIIVGAVFLLLPVLVKLGLRIEEVHPLILLGKKFDGVYVGTSPIVIIILAIIYVILTLVKRS